MFASRYSLRVLIGDCGRGAVIDLMVRVFRVGDVFTPQHACLASRSQPIHVFQRQLKADLSISKNAAIFQTPQTKEGVECS